MVVKAALTGRSHDLLLDVTPHKCIVIFWKKKARMVFNIIRRRHHHHHDDPAASAPSSSTLTHSIHHLQLTEVYYVLTCEPKLPTDKSPPTSSTVRNIASLLSPSLTLTGGNLDLSSITPLPSSVFSFLISACLDVGMYVCDNNLLL